MAPFNPYLHGLGEMNVAELAEVIYHADGASETTEVEWKRDWDFDSRPKRASLARHLIAFANRDPDLAARLFKGHAFLLVGVEPGCLGTIAELDPADLYQRLSRFTGTEFGWHPVYVTVDGARVLVIVVDPPRWGDPAFGLAAGSRDPDTGHELLAGTVYVRRPGATVPATPADLKRLEERARTPRPELRIVLDWNFGQSGNYIAVNVSNGPTGRAATLLQVGLTQQGLFKVGRLPGIDYPPGAPAEAGAYASLPISEQRTSIEPSEEIPFRVPLGGLPFWWDDETEIYPYAYYDDGHWLVGDPSPVVRLLVRAGWIPDAHAEPMFESMRLDYVWPDEVSGLFGRFNLVDGIPLDKETS